MTHMSIQLVYIMQPTPKTPPILIFINNYITFFTWFLGANTEY